MDTQLVLTVISPLAAVAAILFVVGRATGGPRDARIETSDVAVTAVQDADLDYAAGEVTLSMDRQAALVADSRNGAKVAVAYVHGDRVAARVITHRDIRHLSWDVGSAGTTTLRLRLVDFGCPELELSLRNADVDRWRPRLESVIDANSLTSQQTPP